MKRWSLLLATLLTAGLAGGYLVGPMLHGQPPVPSATLKDVTSYRDIVKKVLPAVVSIETQAKVVRTKATQPWRSPHDQFGVPEEFRKFFKDMPFDFDDMPEQQVPRTGFGSGFLIRADGVVLTNYHVVAGADHVTVTLNDGRKFNSKSIKGDRRTDLAIVRLDNAGRSLPYLELGDSDTMEIGDRVLAVGAPFGLRGSVTQGIVSAKGRNDLNMNMYEDFIQTDAAINPGNSGGPLVSLDGKVIGINSAIKTRSGGFQGVGLAVASNLAKSVVRSLEKDGVVHRGYLGVQIRRLDPEVARRLGAPKDTGVLVGQVFENTPAGKAGIQEGDVVTEIAGKKVKDGRSLQHLVAALPLKKPVDVNVVRDGKNLVLHVTIEEQPGDYGYARAPVQRGPNPNARTVPLDKIGIEVADLNEEMAEELGYGKSARGAVIARVDSDSIAFQAGLRRGMLISKVDNHKVATAESARQALDKASLAQGVLLHVQSPQGGTNIVLLRKTANE
jgi:serine protease Do